MCDTLENIAIPPVSDKRVLIPHHSFYADDPNKPDDEPLLIQLIKFHSVSNPLNYFLSEIIAPLINAWTLLVSEILNIINH